MPSARRQASLTATIWSKTCAVAAGEERAAVDDHVDLVGAGGDGVRGVGELDRAARRGRSGTPSRRRRRDEAVVRDRRARRRAPRRRTAPCRRRRRPRRRAGVVGSDGSGVIAFATSERTLPGVSAPSRVVRSMSSMILSSAQAFEVVLIERVPRPAARCSRPTASTPESPSQVQPQARLGELAAEQLRRRAPPGASCDGLSWSCSMPPIGDVGGLEQSACAVASSVTSTVHSPLVTTARATACLASPATTKMRGLRPRAAGRARGRRYARRGRGRRCCRSRRCSGRPRRRPRPCARARRRHPGSGSRCRPARSSASATPALYR